MTQPETVEIPQGDVPAEPVAEAATTDAPAAEAPPEPTEAERMEAVFEKAASDTPEAAPEEPAEPEPEAAPEPAAESEPAAEPEPEPEADLTDEQKDEAEAKSLGFKNQKATAEFKRMRAAEREAAPLLKDYEERAKPMAQRWEHLMDYCDRAKIPPDIFGNGMAMLAGIVSTDLDVMRKTRDGLQMEVRKLNEKLGEGEDAVTRHDDLRAAVESGDITQDLATRIAAERAAAQHHETIRQSQADQDRARAAHTEATEKAIAEIDAIQQEYEGLDPHFKAKVDPLIPILRPIFAKLPPGEWASAFKEAYRNAPTPTAAPASTQRPAPLRNQPLRSTSAPVGSVAATPSTPEEIMDAAIRSANSGVGVA